MTAEQTKQLNKIISQIAAEKLGLDTLETRHSDSLDFHDLAVWSIKAALIEAFQAGQRSKA